MVRIARREPIADLVPTHVCSTGAFPPRLTCCPSIISLGRKHHWATAVTQTTIWYTVPYNVVPILNPFTGGITTFTFGLIGFYTPLPGLN